MKSGETLEVKTHLSEEVDYDYCAACWMLDSPISRNRDDLKQIEPRTIHFNKYVLIFRQL